MVVLEISTAIVLFADDKAAYLIHSLTTSQNNQLFPAIQHGCSVYKNVPYYFFPQNLIVGDDGFYFEKDTFIFFNNNVRKESFAKFDAASKILFGVISLGTLANEELKRIIKCVLKSRFIPQEIEIKLNDFKTTLL